MLSLSKHEMRRLLDRSHHHGQQAATCLYCHQFLEGQNADRALRADLRHTLCHMSANLLCPAFFADLSRQPVHFPEIERGMKTATNPGIKSLRARGFLRIGRRLDRVSLRG